MEPPVSFLFRRGCPWPSDRAGEGASGGGLHDQQKQIYTDDGLMERNGAPLRCVHLKWPISPEGRPIERTPPPGPELSHKFFEVVLVAFKAPKIPGVFFSSSFEDKAKESGSGTHVCSL